VLLAGHSRVALVSRDDVAAAIAAVAAKPNRSRIVYTITGHRPLGFGEIAATYGEAFARQVRYRPCSIDRHLTWASANCDDPWPYAFCISIAEGRYSEVSRDFAALTGLKPEIFRDFSSNAR
jgi:NAD(P)H dehydrogenase (quinone)